MQSAGERQVQASRRNEHRPSYGGRAQAHKRAQQKRWAKWRQTKALEEQVRARMVELGMPHA